MLVGAFRLFVLDRRLRGRDQRRGLVRLISAVHPLYRRLCVAAFLLLLPWLDRRIGTLACHSACDALALAFGIRVFLDFFLAEALTKVGRWPPLLPSPGQVGAASVDSAVACLGRHPHCGVFVLVVVAVVAVAWAAAAVAASVRAAAAEAADVGLSEEHLAAAACAATYVEGDGQLEELRARGVESTNWRVDRQLSTPTALVLVNSYAQIVLVAFRGTVTRTDWTSNLKRIVPGHEERSASFIEALELARAAQLKYLLVRRVWLTGHSRGGGMADFVGRKLGLRSIQINPARFGRAFWPEEPALQSITSKTAVDLVSMMDWLVFGDRRVQLRWPKNHARNGLLPALLLVTYAVLVLTDQSEWVSLLTFAALVASMVWYITWIHSVLRFTRK